MEKEGQGGFPNSLPPAYAELHCLSNFTFLRGASHPQELIRQAHALGYAALAITDECSLAGAVRAHVAAADCGLRLIIGTELTLADGLKLVLLAADRAGYGRLCALITRGRRAAAKGSYRLSRDDFAGGLAGCRALWIPGEHSVPADARWVRDRFPGCAWIAFENLLEGDAAAKLARLSALARGGGLPLAAAGDVHMHVPQRRRLQDTLTAIRLGTTVQAAGYALYPNAERHLRARRRLARLYPPALLQETLRVIDGCTFSLAELRYEYPAELVPAGETPASHLRRLTLEGARRRWPRGMPPGIEALLAKELEIIAGKKYEAFFLTVHDIVRFARGRGILCQGRGSAANSAVCFCLHITEVDPVHGNLLFERFVSRERDEPPDIDVDFEHERREEVMQYVYGKYGRERAALAATVIRYRPRSALRDVGKALGLDPAQVDRIARSTMRQDACDALPERFAGDGDVPPLLSKMSELVGTLAGFPRHLSQHVGGFVISKGPLSELVPVENAAMRDRTVIQWDKDDLEALGLLKVDCLALGMLSAIRRALDLANNLRGTAWTMATIPQEDPEVYAMISAADTVGVFQIESRAQMSMLPRLKPATFYDLVVQIAIVRPGPIVGRMVHPYLRNRERLRHGQRIDSPYPALEPALKRTLGVPIFQEQVMQIAMIAAGYTPGAADRLRRDMAAWKHSGNLERHRTSLVGGMLARGYERAFAERIFEQIRGFGEYGFPESHAHSFALLAYVSAWLKHREPAAFTAALLNSQPMGFYAPAQLVQDAKRHGVEVRPVSVLASAWECTLEVIECDASTMTNPPHPPFCKGGSTVSGGRFPPLENEEQGVFPQAPEPAMDPGSRSSPFEKKEQETYSRLSKLAVDSRNRPPSLENEGQGGFRAKPSPALRLGLRMVKGLSRSVADRIAAAREKAAFTSIDDLARRAALERRDLGHLADAGALDGLSRHRPEARWITAGIDRPPPLLADAPAPERLPELPAPTEGRDILEDYASVGLTLRRHPMALLRESLARLGMRTARELRQLRHGQRTRAAGIVIGRQRPATAKGTIFVTLEDETGCVNVVVWPHLAGNQRRELLASRLMGVDGVLERQGEVVHLVAHRLEDHTRLLGGLPARSRDFH